MSQQTLQRSRWVFAGLVALWILVVAWQALEHLRVRRQARAELVNRARDISDTLGLVIRSQRRFGGFVSKDRIESALASLVRPGELNAIALLNDAEEVVASAGAPIEFQLKALAPRSELWTGRTVVLMNLVDLGTNVAAESDPRNATIVVPRSELPPFGTNRPPGPPPGPPPDDAPPPGSPRTSGFGPGPGPGPGPEPGPGGGPAPASASGSGRRPDEGAAPGTNREPGSVAPPGPGPGGTNAPARGRGRPRRGDGRFPFDRPFWMSEEQYRSLAQKQGVHSFVLVLSTASLRSVLVQDLGVRALITAFAGVAAVGFLFAWRNLTRSADLEVRLARAAELNDRLKEMNLAAAGLAHETRNPLNIIRGLAQWIAREESTPAPILGRVRDIVAETDRVTAQLSEFINYSRPREVRWATVPLASVVAEVARALGSDLEDRAIRFQLDPNLPEIAGDEALVRQALFNLLLNAIQAVGHGGTIEVAATRPGPDEVRLEIRDDGPGVAPEHLKEIFKPYFTTHEEGTGLGLAVVDQIVRAHGWEIECLPNSPRGAVFRLDHLKVPGRS